jgi:hypothetical protein
MTQNQDENFKGETEICVLIWIQPYLVFYKMPTFGGTLFSISFSKLSAGSGSLMALRHMNL